MGSLDAIFNARSVAVVGASASPDKTGHIILKNILDGGYSGSLYPVNPRAETILGLTCYPSLSAIPGGLDLVVVVVPAKLVPGVIDEGGRKGIKGAVVISGGFGEIGNGELEDQVKAAAARYGVRVIGPNCQGFNYTPNRLCASWPLVKSGGPIAVISQSGTVGAAIEMWAEQEEIGVSGFVALGNKCDVNELDLVEFFAGDPNTKVIALYIEGIRDGQGFMKLMRSVSGRKPVVVLKPGKTEKGKKAVASHTHSIAGSDEVFQGVCRQLRITRASDVAELYDFSKALGYLKRPKGRKMLVVTSSGGCGILATDTAEQSGIEVAELDGRTKEELKKVLPETCVIGNPLDLTGDANAERYGAAVETAARTAGADFFLLIFGDPIPGACEIVQGLRGTIPQEIVVCYLGGGETEKREVLKMHRGGIPVFPTPERAVKAVNALLASYTSERS
jgi:acetyl coenzyme A synthetase (ADP forming)-like protein